MNRIYVPIILLLSHLTVSFDCKSKEVSQAASHRYFGQTPPGLTPKLFAPDILSPDGLFEGGVFSPDMNAFYFSRKNGKYKKRTFFVIHYENNRWGNEIETDNKWPLFSLDGKIMYNGKLYRERTIVGWSEPKSLGKSLKDQAHGLSVSANGTLYFPFFKKEDNGHGNLGYSRKINGEYEKPIKLSTEINSGDYIAHPYVAPDESYLMWDVERDDNQGSHQPDLYISFKEVGGAWGPAINMGKKINTPIYEQSPYVTPDGKYLFFKRGKWVNEADGTRRWVGKSYWVDAQVIETLRP